MKILEAQNSVLSNHEVYQHLIDHQERRKVKNRRGLATIVNEVGLETGLPCANTKEDKANQISQVLKYLRTHPNPFPSHGPSKIYDRAVVSRLLERLDAANLNQDLAKGEVLMILNLRPNNDAVLSAIIEDSEERFSEEERETILSIIADVLGLGESGANGHASHGGAAIPSVENGA